MSIDQESAAGHLSAGMDGSNPFADAPPASAPVRGLGFTPWTDNESPFTEQDHAAGESEFRTALSDALAELRDEAFDEAVAHLVAETEQLVQDRFQMEGSGYGTEKLRLAEAHLSPVGLAAEEYLDHLAQGLSALDMPSLGGAGLAGVLDGFDPQPNGLSPAGEEFLGSLVKKARRAVGTVVTAAKKVGSTVAGPLVQAALGKLKALVRPLLKRVLSFAIDKLPAPLRGPARTLAQKVALEAAEADDGGLFAPAMAMDPLSLAESFDEALGEALVSGASEDPDSFAGQEAEAGPGPQGGAELESLAAARRDLAERIAQADDGEDLTPAIEQFVPVLLTALRAGLKLAGRQRVVDFLAGYVARLIGRWVGPQQSRPLSSAIVDTGLRLMSLEQPASSGPGPDPGPALLAATVEDTVRRLATTEEYMLEDQDLMQLAVSEAFEAAVATSFPAVLVRAGLQQAPSLAGSFLPIATRGAHPYRRYSRAPQIDLGPRLADAVVTFGAVPLGAVLRAGGASLPQRFQLHIFEAAAGTSLEHLARNETGIPGLGGRAAALHPLTTSAAGLLLQEPGLGIDVPDRYLASRQRIAVGQRFYSLEPLDGMARMEAEAGGGAAPRPSRRRISVNLSKARVTTTFYLSEPDSQRIATAIKQSRGVPALLAALTVRSAPAAGRLAEELEDEEAGFAASALRSVAPAILRALRRRAGAWSAAAVADWARQRSGEFVLAAADPAEGVTVTVALTAVPGLNLLRDARAGRLAPEALQSVLSGAAFKGSPAAAVAVSAGRAR